MSTQQILRILYVVSWIGFVGQCIATGAMLFFFIVNLFTNSLMAENLYLGKDLSEVYDHGEYHFAVIAIFLLLVSGLKAYLFLQVIKIIDRINIERPFSEIVRRFISKMSVTALLIGIIGVVGSTYADVLFKNEVNVEIGATWTGFLFLAGILYVIAQIFKRGIELQSENELTV